jgi:methylmalonyl-CoA mutase cobalamin-binding subunit
MIADRFDMAGWTTYFLGADSPVEEVIDAARTLAVDAVALTSATHFHRLGVRHFVDRLERELDHVYVWVGGSAFVAGDEGFASYEVRDIDTILAELTPASSSGAEAPSAEGSAAEAPEDEDA